VEAEKNTKNVTGLIKNSDIFAMSNRNIFIVSTALIAIIVGVLLVINQVSRPVQNQEKTVAKGNIINKETSDNSRYIAYSKDILKNSQNTRRVLYFYANWCPTCLPANDDLSSKADQIPSDVTVIRVNYNDSDTDEDEKELARKYGITYQHTFVQIDSEGKEIAKWNGGQLKELLENIK